MKTLEQQIEQFYKKYHLENMVPLEDFNEFLETIAFDLYDKVQEDISTAMLEQMKKRGW
jgi:hypothetical protein